MGSLVAPEIREAYVGEVLLASVDFQGALDSGELLTGTPTVTELTTSDLTISNESVSTSELTINSVTVATGKAVQFKVSGQQAGTTYNLIVTCSTDSTPTQTLKRKVRLKGVATT